MQRRNVAIFLFEQVEVLDFAGPFEVFSMAQDSEGNHPFNVYTFSRTGLPLYARNGLGVTPRYSMADMPPADILLIPGAPNAAMEREMLDDDLTGWIAAQYEQVELLLSVCTGAWLLAKAGLLAGKSATTYHTDYERLKELEPHVTTCPGQRWADNGDLITSAGVSAGIDMSLYVVQKLFDAATANATARRIEYDYFQAQE